MQKAVALYLRLSQEDVDVRRNAAKDESNSISAQRKLVTRRIDDTPNWQSSLVWSFVTMVSLERTFTDQTFGG